MKKILLLMTLISCQPEPVTPASVFVGVFKSEFIKIVITQNARKMLVKLGQEEFPDVSYFGASLIGIKADKAITLTRISGKRFSFKRINVNNKIVSDVEVTKQ